MLFVIFAGTGALSPPPHCNHKVLRRSPSARETWWESFKSIGPRTWWEASKFEPICPRTCWPNTPPPSCIMPVMHQIRKQAQRTNAVYFSTAATESCGARRNVAPWERKDRQCLQGVFGAPIQYVWLWYDTFGSAPPDPLWNTLGVLKSSKHHPKIMKSSYIHPNIIVK